jgi:hypothetical protein
MLMAALNVGVDPSADRPEQVAQSGLAVTVEVDLDQIAVGALGLTDAIGSQLARKFHRSTATLFLDADLRLEPVTGLQSLFTIGKRDEIVLAILDRCIAASHLSHRN